MLARLRLREQGLVLVTVPLLFELLFVCVLSVMLLDLEKAGASESQAKTILSLTTDLDQSSMASITNLAALALSGGDTFAERMQQSIDKVNSLCIQLRTALQNDSESLAAFADIEKQYHDIFKRIADLSNAYDRNSQKFYFVQFTTDVEYFEQLSFDMKQLAQKTRAISNKYSKTIAVLDPRAASFRSVIRGTIVAGIIGNIWLCVYLGICFSRTLVGRVRVIIENTSRFKDGRELLPKLSGIDEISELDATFRSMALTKLRAEQMRKDLVAMVSHDLRNPLTSIHGYLLMLLSQFVEISPQASKMVERAASELSRLIRLTQDLLDEEKIAAGSLTLVIDQHQAADLVFESVQVVSSLAEIKKIDLIRDVPLSLGCYCDRDRVVQILVNLLLNAIRFSPTHSNIEISARLVENTVVEFAVLDHGPGVPQAQADQIFERFVQLNQEGLSARQGHGLGLAICKSLTELHGGSIGVESHSGTGSRFWFRIPMSQKNEEASKVIDPV